MQTVFDVFFVMVLLLFIVFSCDLFTDILYGCFSGTVEHATLNDTGKIDRYPTTTNTQQRPLLLARFNINPSMDK